MIEISDVTVRAGRTTLLDRVNLDVRDGEVIALFGPNGAGKSTLLAAMAGDRRLASGSIRLAGRDVCAMSPSELAIRRVVLRQKSSLNAAFTALEVVCLGQLRGCPRLAQQCLAEVELASMLDRAYPSLSGGEQQRVQLARALAQLDGSRTAAFLLDEPAAALDLRQAQLVARIARGRAGRGHAVVLVAHDIDLVARCADRVALLHRGALLAVGSPDDVLTSALISRAFDVSVELERTTGGLLAIRCI